jgi:hypothetical protein
MIVADPNILSSDWMLIGRQEQTPFGGRIDLLAIMPDASLVLIELKRDRTPREVVAQALDYASWVKALTPEKIAQIYQRFSKGGTLDEAFKSRFGTPLEEESLNKSHQIILVASELDDATERIIRYLSDSDLASAGGGAWYTQTLKALSPGDRVWVKIPGKGYVGVGRVTESVQSLSELKLNGVPCLDVLKTADRLRERATDPEMIEAFVRVEWLDTVLENKAFNEIGLFGNQNTVCQPTTPKWRHTVERLKTYFKKWE